MQNSSIVPRNDILEILNKRLGDFKEGYRQNIALLGEKLIGKTTLLKLFLNGLEDEQLIPTYVEILPFEFDLFIKRFLNSLLYNFLKKHQIISSRENMSLLVKRAKELLPQTVGLIENILQRLPKEKSEIIFRDLFSIVESFQMESQKRCIIIFDEFHHLKTLGVKNICLELGKKIMFQKNTFFLFASSLQTVARIILAEDLNLLFGNFETIELQPLDTQASARLIANKFTPIKLPNELKNFLINFTGGYPFYLSLICDKAVVQCRNDNKGLLDQTVLLDTLQKLLFYQWGILNLKFSAFLASFTSGRNRKELIYILDAIACGKTRLKDLAQQLRRPKKEINQKIGRLIEQGVVSKNGAFYLIHDRLLSFWLKFVHTEKMNCLSTDEDEQIAYFRSKIQAQIEEFIQTSKQPVSQRLFDLFNAFEGDAIQMGRKRFQLSPFKELKLITFDHRDLKIGIFGKAQDSIWITAIKENGINEHDIHEFILLSKKYKHKLVNKIIVVLGDIDRNARLLAKESSIETWDAVCLNNLFDLFGKPRIIP